MANARKKWREELDTIAKDLDLLLGEKNVRDEFNQEELEESIEKLKGKIPALSDSLISWDPTSTPRKYEPLNKAMQDLRDEYEKIKIYDENAKDLYSRSKSSEEERQAVISNDRTPSTSGLTSFLSIFCCAGKKDYEKIEAAEEVAWVQRSVTQG